MTQMTPAQVQGVFYQVPTKIPVGTNVPQPQVISIGSSAPSYHQQIVALQQKIAALAASLSKYGLKQLFNRL